MGDERNGRTVQWPIEAVGDSDDLSNPTRELLTSLGFMAFADDEIESKVFGTPYSLQVIKAGSLALTKWWTGIIAGVGGVTGLAALIARPWTVADEPVKIAYVAAAAFLLAAVAVSIAIIVRSDVSARARAAQAEYLGRAQVATGFLEATRTLTPTPQHWVSKSSGGAQLAVRGLEFDATEGLLFVTEGDKIPANRVERAGSRSLA